ncbi:helix-turn-helix transcriptional regulator [Clostridium sp. JS66]|uniref:helix-turn-helix domain-containing protein n=1 Tax=Clostridium sp. JS66 TaxID=3064705 RepID=UPI00298E444F|nr:helix-turn-helix transcriptional regulator [Clostridium sp. JS66]WPC42919.1 helix-turn-helix transcriptional regulator [Clostridium sp. JS66]
MIKCNLNKYLESRKLTKYWLSKATGISTNALSNLANGRTHSISFDMLSKICTKLDCQIGDILENVKEYTEINKIEKAED